MPRNRLGLAAWSASNTGATRSPRFRLARPTMAAAARQGPYRPLALAAASPWTNSTSPMGRSSSGPSVRYIARASINTVGAHVVTAGDVGDQLVEEIPLVRYTLGAKIR